ENDPAKVADADREIQALVDHLGLRDGTPGADGRLALIEEQGHLPPGTRDLLDANLQRSLDEIRTGTPGHVRSEAELSNADVIRSLQDQLQEIKPAQVDDIIGRFPAADQERARQVLARSSGYGDMESLNSLRAAAEPYLAKGAELYTPGQGSLADNLTYLATEKKVFHDTPGDIAPTREIKQGTVVILDDVVLAKIKSDPAFARSLRDHGAVLLDPRGFAEGNNMFNAGTPDAIARRTARLLDAATEIQARSGGKMSFDDAITAALDRPALETLAAADPALAGQRRVVDPAGHPDTSSEAIAGKLNGDAGISEARLEAALSRVPEADRGYLRELLAQQGEVFSPRRIANSLEAQHQRIMQHAAEHGIAPDKVYYFILEPSKSYDMVAMAHRAVTETPVDHYISGADALAARHLGPDTMLVILDDVAGSGNSLKNKASPAAANTGYPGEIVVSPVVSTTDAVSLFEGRPRPGSNLEGGSPAPYLPEKVIQSLRSSPFYQSLSHADQAELEALVGHLGFDENGLSMAFPYMAPNNNNLFFSDQIAQWFIMNKTRGASKVTKGMDQTWDPDRRP
ncbi:MAG TPA: hypothetical protein VFD36_12560, partial [Kofleriaceae bacterium]|nr:hypothetical protein [Kofleriaceae bacterium]